MGEIADFILDQAEWRMYEEDDYYIPPPHTPPPINIKAAEQEFSIYKETEMPKTYTIDMNPEKKIYRVKPPLARGSFMQRILEPEAFSEGDKPEWGCQLRWPMADEEVKAWAGDMGRMFTQVFIDKFGEKKGMDMIKSPNVKIPLRNGDHEENEEYHGQLFMNVRNKFRQPIILGPTGDPLPPAMIDDQVIYSGAWYRSRIVFRYFDVKSKGIGAYLEVLMKIKDDNRLDSVISIDAAKDEFSGFATDDVDALSPPDDDAKDDFDFL